MMQKHRNTPSGFMASTLSASVSNGTTVTLQPRALSDRMMLSLMPQSTATTLNFGFEVRLYHRFLLETKDTTSCFTGVSAMIFKALSTVVSFWQMSARRLPFSRIERVSFRVSMPEMPGMPHSSMTSESVLV